MLMLLAIQIFWFALSGHALGLYFFIQTWVEVCSFFLFLVFIWAFVSLDDQFVGHLLISMLICQDATQKGPVYIIQGNFRWNGLSRLECITGFWTRGRGNFVSLILIYFCIFDLSCITLLKCYWQILYVHSFEFGQKFLYIVLNLLCIYFSSDF